MSSRILLLLTLLTMLGSLSVQADDKNLATKVYQVEVDDEDEDCDPNEVECEE